MQGDLKAAEADYRAALAVGTEMGPQKRYPVCLDLADVLAAEGRIADAKALGEEALESARQSSDPESIALSETVLAHVLALEGRFVRTRSPATTKRFASCGSCMSSPNWE